MDHIAKVPKQCSEEDQGCAGSASLSVDEHEAGHIISCGSIISVWIAIVWNNPGLKTLGSLDNSLKSSTKT